MPELLTDILTGSYRSLARTISLVENRTPGYMDLLLDLPGNEGCTVIGITGPPGAGKSTLADSLIGEIVANGKRAGIVCVDPSSPFTLGALLGDRIRMSRWYNHPSIYIRSLANRGSLGGLHPFIIEITDVMKAFGFDYVIVETVGVGQSEVEIAGLADTTVVVLVPEAGDDVQIMKAGLMEIADIFVINKADREGANTFEGNLRTMLRPGTDDPAPPIILTNALTGKGIAELFQLIGNHGKSGKNNSKHAWLLAEKAYQLIASAKMKNLQKQEIYKSIKSILENEEHFNLYKFVAGLPGV